MNSASTGGGGSSGGGAGIVLGAVAVVGALYLFTSPDGIEGVSFAHDLDYAIAESGYSYRYGGRADFQKNNWQFYLSAEQENANGDFGDFAYSAGTEYDGGFWSATLTESVRSDSANYNFSLSADFWRGIWKISPTYRFQTHLENGESDSRNLLNLESALHYHRWTIRPSAGFNWRRADEFGENARFLLEAEREF